MKKQTEVQTITATLINYFDVWGNIKDGFEVNNLCKEGEVELPETYTDKDILKALKDAGFLGKRVRLNMLDIEDMGEMIEISQRRINGRLANYPIGRLEFPF